MKYEVLSFARFISERNKINEFDVYSSSSIIELPDGEMTAGKAQRDIIERDNKIAANLSSVEKEAKALVIKRKQQEKEENEEKKEQAQLRRLKISVEPE